MLKNVNKLRGTDAYINENYSRETNEIKEKAVGGGKTVAFRG